MIHISHKLTHIVNVDLYRNVGTTPTAKLTYLNHEPSVVKFLWHWLQAF